MRFKTLTVKGPSWETEARKQSAQLEAATQAHKRRISFMLRDITSKIISYPACPKSEMSLEDFRQQPKTTRRYTSVTPIRVAHMHDGVGIVFMTKDFLEDRVHRITIPQTDEVEYSRWAINVDSQKIPSNTVALVGLEQLAADSDFYPSLHFCMGALAVEASNGWNHAFK